MLVRADGAGVLAVEIAAIGTGPDGSGGLGQGGGERQHPGLRLLQHLQGSTPSAARTHTRQLGEQTDQVIDFRAAHGSRQFSIVSCQQSLAGGGLSSSDASRKDPLTAGH